jgi:hypothetical protein
MSVQQNLLQGIPPEQAAVVMLCGPHKDPTNQEYSPQFHRIDAATEVARQLGIRLFVAGDATGGRDVALFVARARAAGVEAIEVYDAIGNTEGDVCATLRRLLIAEFAGIRHLVLVTGFAHTIRVFEWFNRMKPQILGTERPLTFSFHPVMEQVTEQEMLGEIKGIVDCRLGRERDPYGPPIGKPSEAAIASYDSSGQTH